MSVSRTRIFLDNQSAGTALLDRFARIRVDLAVGMAGEAELTLPVGADATGFWPVLEEDFVQPFTRVRIEVSIRDGEFIPLIDGPVIGQRFRLSARADDSAMTLTVQDDSVLLNQDEEVATYEDQSADEIARDLFRQFGLEAETDSVSLPSGGLERYQVQRGTAMQFLRELARRHGMFVYVEPGGAPGRSTGHFKRPDLEPAGYPDLRMMGPGHNMGRFDASFDALRPLKARAGHVDITDQETLSAETEAAGVRAQGATPVHDMLGGETGRVLLRGTREREQDLEAATGAAVDHSSWAYSAEAEVIADNYAAVLRPHRVITVRGVGGHLSGDWLLTRVTHQINEGRYSQAFTMKRNARAGGGGAAGGVSLTGGIF